MKKTHIIRLHHPSGQLYSAFCDFVGSHPQAGFFQSDIWCSLLQQWKEADCILLLAIDSRQKILGSLVAARLRMRGKSRLWGLLPEKAYRSLTTACQVIGGPLLAEGSELQHNQCLDMLLEALVAETKRESLYVELRNEKDWSAQSLIFRDHGFEFHTHQNQLIDVFSRDDIWEAMGENRRSQVKSSLDKGAGIIDNPGPSQIDAFYAILSDLYAREIRKPLPPLSVFQSFARLVKNHPPVGYTPAARADDTQPEQDEESPLLGLAREYLSSDGLKKQPSSHDAEAEEKTRKWPVGRVFLVEYQGRIIGGIVCPISPGRRIHEWYICGMDKEYAAEKVFPGVLASWAAMEYAALNEIPLFDFMGTGKPDEFNGPGDFKRGLGGRQTSYGRYLHVQKPLLYALFRFALPLRQRLPRR